MEKINLICTIISIVVTIVSIVCSICAFISAKKAFQYKMEALHLRDTFDLKGLLAKFDIEGKYFLDKTRRIDWYKGVDTNAVITPFKAVLSSFGSSYHLLKNPDELKDKVHRLNQNVQTFDRAKKSEKQETTNLILEITEILNQEIRSNEQEIANN